MACVWVGNWALASKGCRSLLGIITLKHPWPSCAWMLQCTNSWHCLFCLQPTFTCRVNADSACPEPLLPLLPFSLSLFSFWLTPPRSVWCPRNLYMTPYQWYCSVSVCLVFHFGITCNTCYLLNQFVFIICVVAREHGEQFLSLIF